MPGGDSGGEGPRQLTLGVHLDDDATFENFYVAPGSSSAQLVSVLQAQLLDTGEPSIFVWGATGSGVSHLLQAACHRAELLGLSAQYLPLSNLSGDSPVDVLQHLETLDLVCVDDVHAVVGHLDWERALFHFFNAMRDCGRRVLLGSDSSPRQLPVKLADLQSRLNWGLVFQLQPLGDAAKCLALQARAGKLGMDMSDQVARFILHRWSRHTQQLFACLRLLDRASLEQQRRLTVPFVKQVLKL